MAGLLGRSTSQICRLCWSSQIRSTNATHPPLMKGSPAPKDATLAARRHASLASFCAAPLERLKTTPYRRLSETPLYHVLAEGREDLERIVAALLEGGADVHAGRGDGRSALHVAVEHRRRWQVISMLLEAGADTSLTALLLATLQDASATVDPLLSTGVDPNEADHFGWTPLHFAMFDNNLSTIMSLVDAGADPNAEGADGDTPMIRYLDRAASEAAVWGIVVRALLNASADPNKTAANGRAPLHLATTYEVRPR